MGKVKTAVIWSIIEKFGLQAISLIIGLFLARLLSPADFGLIGMTSIFISLSNVFIEAGFSNALVRKLDRDDYDLSTAFYFNIIVGVIMYSILYIVAPYIASFFDEQILCSLIRIIGLNVLFNSLCIVQHAQLIADLKIREKTIIGFLTQIPIGLLTIFLAYKGLGVYALAVQSVGGCFLSTFLLWHFVKWRPSLKYSQKSMKYLWGFGSNIIAANLIGTIFNEIYSLLIGKKFGKQELGYYTKGRSLAMYPNMVFIGVIQNIALPILSKYQDKTSEMLSEYRNMAKLMNGIMSIVSGLLIVIAAPLIIMLWSDKWIDSIWIFQFIIIINILSPFGTLNLILLQVINKTKYTLKLEYIKKPVAILIILFLIPYGIKGLLYAQLLMAIFETFLNATAPKKFINYKYRWQLYDLIQYLYPILISCLLSFSILSLFKVNVLFQLIIGSVAYLSAYTFILLIRKDTVFYPYLNKFLNEKFLKKLLS